MPKACNLNRKDGLEDEHAPGSGEVVGLSTTLLSFAMTQLLG